MQERGKNMKIKEFVFQFIFTFIITFIVTAVVTLLWSLIFHGIALVDWETAFRFAKIFCIVFGIINCRKGKKTKK